MPVEAYPLRWPQHVPRKKVRVAGRFSSTTQRSFSSGGTYRAKTDLSIAEAIRRLFDELDRLGAQGIVVSSNVEVRQDGLPRSGARKPDDPGVCVYFHHEGRAQALPCDTYTEVAQNIAAIAKHLEAVRAIERFGVSSAHQMFDGFVALPSNERHWWEVFGWKAPTKDRAAVEARYRAIAKERHPDSPGGSHAAMAELNRAKEEALNHVAG